MGNQNRTKRHHYVPEFYLRHFLDERDQVWIYDKRAEDIEASIRFSDPSNVGLQGNIYSVRKEDGTYDDRIDEWLQGVENKAAPIHRKLISGLMVDGQEKADYAVFLSSLATRTPAILNRVAELHGAYIQSRTDKILADEQRFRQEIQNFKESPFCADPNNVDVDAIAHFLKNRRYKLRINQRAGLMAFQVTDKLTDKFFEMTWSLYESQSSRFITSDNPLVQTFVGTASRSEQSARPIEVATLPLSPSVMLELRWKSTESAIARRTDKDVARLYNSMRAANAEQFVFASRRDVAIAALVQKYRHHRMEIDLSKFGPTKDFAPMEVARKL
ncbi:DUF4238 domain-containing protein [Rhizobium sp. WL3]|uniref:DUF4238 domain-containing protein n=1 Tax=Rhizobium sp. WL3 TaxID=2603277 RepID=UPI0011C20709|nr:DUF4238 domain-containing protein [Rhizobium sp. WL3]QEE47338.1 DUF4238 domain-containing protein [Rhizobium sp. WL3]